MSCNPDTFVLHSFGRVGPISGVDDGSDDGGDDGDDHDHEGQVVSLVMRICPSGRIRGNCSETHK